MFGQENSMEEQMVIKKLDEFIRKYYKNKFFRGLILATIILLSLFFLLIILEFFYYFNPAVRSSFFVFYILLSFFLMYHFVVNPLLKMYRRRKGLTHAQAAIIIGEHFPEIQDKLLNALQLIQQRQTNSAGLDLIIAGIEQKTQFLKVFNYGKIIQFTKNLRFLRFFIPAVVLLLFMGFFFPEMLTGPTRRLILFTQAFTPPLPFHLELLNKNFRVMQQEDFELLVKLKGKEIPGELFVNTAGNRYKMKRLQHDLYSYVFKSIQENIRFNIEAGKFYSENYEIIVFPKPMIIRFDMVIRYPDYLKRVPETIENTSDLNIPEGTEVCWNFFTKDVENLSMRFNDSMKRSVKLSGNQFKFIQSFSESTTFTMIPQNKYVARADSLRCQINIIKDAYPSISIKQESDSGLTTGVFISGLVKDDYGFSKLTFNYQIKGRDDIDSGKSLKIPLNITPEPTTQLFYFHFNLSELGVESGKSLKFGFEIWDNDGINGAKSTQSETRTITTRTLEEIIRDSEKVSEEIAKTLEHNVMESSRLNKKLEEQKLKKTEQNKVSWQEIKNMEEMLKSYEKITEEIEKLSKNDLKNIQEKQEYQGTNERIFEKQKELNELMRNILSEELKKDILEMKKLLEQLDKKKLDDFLEKMKFSNKEVEDQLDRALDLYRKIEFERKLEKAISDLLELANKQTELAGEEKHKKREGIKLAEEQKKIENQYDSIKNTLQSLEKDAKKIENTPDLGETESKQNEISQKLAESNRTIQKKNKKEIQRIQKETSEKLSELAAQLENMSEEADAEENVENAQALRKILEGLIDLSFTQEELIKESQRIGRNDPKFQSLMIRQRNMKEKMKSIDDSLTALSKREISIKPMVAKELQRIDRNTDKVLQQLEERNVGAASTSQQFVMTGLNNLAVLLSEILKQMNNENQSNSENKGNNACKKPSNKGGKKSIKGMKEMQNQISEQIRKLKEGIEKGSKSGKDKKGGSAELNQEIARLAAQQEALRREIQGYEQSRGKMSKEEKENLSNLINELNENERDLIFKRITSESVDRQKLIQSRLLEAENAEEKRDFDENRQAEQVKNLNFSNPIEKIKYNYKMEKENELLRKSPLPVKSFYKNKIDSYLIKIQ